MSNVGGLYIENVKAIFGQFSGPKFQFGESHGRTTKAERKELKDAGFEYGFWNVWGENARGWARQ